jgi:hypothetical protein
MMKMMILAPRRQDMSHAEFRHYLLDVHGPLVRSVEPVARDIRHYHYNFPLDGQSDDAFGHPLASHLDVITQGWFDSRAAQKRNMARPEYMAQVRPDEGRFADEGRAIMHYTQEVVITDGPPTARKLFYLRRRRAGLDRDTFQSRWRAGMTEIVAESAAWAGVVQRYVQNHAMAETLHPAGSDTKFFDLIDELSLRDGAAITALHDDAGLQGDVAALENELLDTSRTLAFAAETIRNID